MAVTRATNVQSTLDFINQIFVQRAALDKARQRVATGLDVSNASDDPARAATISQFQRTLDRLQQHKQRIASVVGSLQAQEGIVSSAQDILLRSEEIALQGSNGTLSAEARVQLANEVFQLRDSLVGLANSRYQGGYVYGGLDDDDAPFDAVTYDDPADANNPASVRYVVDDPDVDLGQDGVRTVRISDSDNITINSPGGQVFSNAISAMERLGRALAGFRTTPEDGSTLPDGGGAAFDLPDEVEEQNDAIREALSQLRSAREGDLSSERTSLGSRMNRVQQAQEIIDVLALNTEATRSAIQDADIFQAASELATLQVNLQGLLQSGARINSLSLLDFL